MKRLHWWVFKIENRSTRGFFHTLPRASSEGSMVGKDVPAPTDHVEKNLWKTIIRVGTEGSPTKIAVSVSMDKALRQVLSEKLGVLAGIGRHWGCAQTLWRA